MPASLFLRWKDFSQFGSAISCILKQTDMAEELAKAAISSLLSSVDLIKAKFNAFKNAEGELKKLESKLEDIRAAIQTANRMPFFNNERVRDWVWKLKDVLYDAEDTIDEYRTSTSSGKKRKAIMSASKSFNRYQLGNNMKSINERLEEIHRERETLGLYKLFEATQSSGTGQNPTSTKHYRETTSLISWQGTVGREVDKKRILESLQLRSFTHGTKCNVSVISITGQGGIGKTTLAKMVFNEVEEEFGKNRWWVCVSEKPDLKELVRKILESVTEKSPDYTQLELLCKCLKKELSDKRFLLVLDDVWDLEWWEQIKTLLVEGAVGSAVLITTRKKQVSGDVNSIYMHKLERLSQEESWHLFVINALKEDKSEYDLVRENVKDIGERIVQKCGGLPLVIQTVGRLLRSKKIGRHEWTVAEKSGIWEWKMPSSSSPYGDILPGLVLSYDDLSPCLKNCFVYCSVYPKDYEIQKNELIMQWIAHGLVEEANGVDMEARANDYLNDLIDRCLIEETKKGVKLHDILHDLALYIGGKEYSHNSATEHTRHLSLTGGSFIAQSELQTSKLHTLLSSCSCGINSLGKVRSLRVLSLIGADIKELPDCIGDLALLKYLGLSGTWVKSLPSSIGRLYNLQTLNLDGSHIEELPKEIGELCNLRYLGLEKTDKLTFVAEGLGKLTHLRTLCKFLACENGCSIRELKELNKLKGSLNIMGLGSITTMTDAGEAQLNKKKSITALRLDFSMPNGATSRTADDDTGELQNESKRQGGILEALQPPHGLENLELSCYKGGALPSTWYLESNYANLQTLRLSCCSHLGTMPVVPALKSLTLEKCDDLMLLTSMPALVKLEVKECNKLNSVANMPVLRKLKLSSCQVLNDLPCFPSLEELKLQYLNIFRGWPMEKGQEGTTAMPHLRTLEVSGCAELKALPPCLESLEEMTMFGLPKWEGFEGGTGEAAALPCLKNAQLVMCPNMQMEGLLPALSKGHEIELQQLTVLVSPCARLKLDAFTRLPKLTELRTSNELLQCGDGDEPPLPSQVSSFLPSLRILHLWGGEPNANWGKVPDWVWGLTQVEEIWLYDFPEQTSLGGGHWQNFKQLKGLYIRKFPKLRYLVDMLPRPANAAEEEEEGEHGSAGLVPEQEQIASLSRLEDLDCYNCPLLLLPRDYLPGVRISYK
ncbi:putative disease resistance protein RGA1 isoform X1 [Nymphaea colorata]|uniref:AAA+ ATPase domain-containing protein n=2 Tax=Nymphaea colorata TaxID=210225 RepID=A0A5K0V176_9MAGN|nr:putative disease resistance protein RGA1 isoform X1 [Nymphaea colorata]XP_031504122.1 putative disease resistance protein RGA1 isoform X1 [Nymphaea colorata]